jgi:beta-glucosidase-like glycosyl hydrolase
MIRPPTALGFLAIFWAACAPYVLSPQTQPEAGDLSAETMVGQLIMASVDGYGYEGKANPALPPALHPEYYRMVRELGLGAVLPHYATRDPLLIRESNRALARMADTPLIIAADYIRINLPRPAEFGDGFSGGILSKLEDFSDAEFARAADGDAAVHRLLGFTMALGPTVDASSRSRDAVQRAGILIAAYRRNGIFACIKHYPLVPAGFNLHSETQALAYTSEELFALEAPFRDLAPLSRAMMSTHVLAPAVDALNAASFSSAWTKRLRASTGFSGILISDGLFMAQRYDKRPLDPRVDADWEAFGIAAPASRLAIASIMAGHDMVILEGTSTQTRRARDALLLAFARSDAAGLAFRARARESYERVIAFKRAMAQTERPMGSDPAGRDLEAALIAIVGS